ncbi:MAG TPA: 16S rRNA (guanine(527)-N(7))-methyltransferase RsmG [Pyrinomonadaceae bacterium]|jgi:16S rRNA (guanine527-N7)-methyltransferase|nr:16S rRNA (guanine(527)-N(7))-methyltransferase RsmG [Pyrinomonadaceae bacterium]
MNQPLTRIAEAAEFRATLEREGADFGVPLTPGRIEQLTAYYELVKVWNPRLHLVAPCGADEFARRHVLESLFALTLLPPDAALVDVGSGAGLPSLPCLIVEPSLRGTLIEASPKKAVFLRECTSALRLSARTTIVNKRFEQTLPAHADALTCRALDRFGELLPQLLRWAKHVKTVLLFGGMTIENQLTTLAVDFQTIHLPHSEQRKIFVVRNK